MSEKRKYRKSIKFYKSNVFGKWKPTTKIFFILAIIGLFVGGTFTINFFNTGNFSIFYKQENKITYVSNSFVTPKNYREIKLSFKTSKEEKEFQEKINYGNIKFYLDYTKQYFVIPNYKPWDEYTVGYCNKKLTDCFIYDRYNMDNYKDEQIYYEVIIENVNPEDEKLQSFWFEPTEYFPKQKITTLMLNIRDV